MAFRLTPPMQAIVDRHGGRDFLEVVLEHLNRHGSYDAAAAALRVHPKTFFNWCQRLGIERRTTVVFEIPTTREVRLSA